MKDKLENKLNDPQEEVRLKALRELVLLYDSGVIKAPITAANVNNHIHTTFSFSPYSPTKAVYMAWLNGLATAGIMDHDSVSGSDEFVEAGKIIDLPVTVGFECRCNIKGTPFEGKRINNPDQISVAYMAMHSIPHNMLSDAEGFLAPYREKRNVRNRKMTAKLNAKLAPYKIEIDFDLDVLPLSQHSLGGSVTERHILYALASKFTENELQRYFLLGMFKSQLVESFYVDADDELPHLFDFIELSEKLGAIPAYAYLGDVGDSVTGDKKQQAFEDSFLDELLEYLAAVGVCAVTYMPTRNSAQQLERVKRQCEASGLFQISGEDINSPMQGFICDKIETPEFRHLIDSAWALIGSERAAGDGISKAMFSPEMKRQFPDLTSRIKYFAQTGKDSLQ